MASPEQPTARFDHVQIDVCPDGVGLILSVGPTSIWLPEPTAREVESKLRAALHDSSPAIAGSVTRLDSDGSN
jgi:hypothetical protein